MRLKHIFSVAHLECYSPPSSADVKNVWSYTSTPQYAFMVWCSIKKSTGATLLLPVSSVLEIITLMH